jgi:hypothetical protein
MATEIRVLARGDILALDVAFCRASGGKLRFIGRKLHIADTREELPVGAVARDRDPVDPGDKYYCEGWERRAEPSLVPCIGEFGNYYLQQLREEALWPADQATAQLAGVTFDPNFGGDYPSSSKASKASKVGE